MQGLMLPPVAASPPLLASASPPVSAAITPHVIEALLSDGVEPVRKTGMLTRDVGAGLEHRDKDFANGKIHSSSIEPLPRLCVSLDGSLSRQRHGHSGCDYYIARN